MPFEITPALTDVFITELGERIKTLGTQEAVAKELEISPSLVTEFLKGRRIPSPAVLKKLGFTRISFHIRTERVKPVVRLIKMALSEDEHMQRLLDKVLEKA